ncbi:hypothetical protein GCM10011509_35400 [Ornithinimicrobium pekingense]|uniref:Uncharacterized protein n=1 Tax=Ornithinimicrobium pekingense TaxID=384677 RepID=A0ABQ2FCK5_9MICO|nr:hypothetical protein GCM10011509_35400 [Ornithinimicrobium pekingense]
MRRYPGQRGQLLVVQLLKGGQVARDDVEQVVGIADQALGAEHVRDGVDGGVEGVQALLGADAEGDEDQCLEVQSEDLWVEHGVVAADRAGAL